MIKATSKAKALAKKRPTPLPQKKLPPPDKEDGELSADEEETENPAVKDQIPPDFTEEDDQDQEMAPAGDADQNEFPLEVGEEESLAGSQKDLDEDSNDPTADSTQNPDSSFTTTTPCGTTTAPADTSSEAVRRMKEKFKSGISNRIIRCLGGYRRKECKYGRITNNEDFKHLARKLTHTIMEKELKHCSSIDDLKITDSVLHKAKDYINRYMVKLGPVYIRSGAPDNF